MDKPGRDQPGKGARRGRAQDHQGRRHPQNDRRSGLPVAFSPEQASRDGQRMPHQEGRTSVQDGAAVLMGRQEEPAEQADPADAQPDIAERPHQEAADQEHGEPKAGQPAAVQMGDGYYYTHDYQPHREGQPQGHGHTSGLDHLTSRVI